MALPVGSVLRPRAGRQRQIADRIAPLVDRGGNCWWTVVVVQDVSCDQHTAAAAQQDLERKLIEIQRVESLGLLAGGIAHDFKNILVQVLGYTELARELIPAESTANGYLARAATASIRRPSLTTQLLAYAGNGQSCVAWSRSIRIVQEVIDLLGGSLLRGIRLQRALDPALPSILGDSTQTPPGRAQPAEQRGRGQPRHRGARHRRHATGGADPGAARRSFSSARKRRIGPHVCLPSATPGTGSAPTTLASDLHPLLHNQSRRARAGARGGAGDRAPASRRVAGDERGRPGHIV